MNRRTPVIVGVAQLAQRTAPNEPLCTTPRLVAHAIALAMQDAGIAPDMGEVDWLGIVDALSRDDRERPAHAGVVESFARAPRHAESSASPSGTSPVRLLEDLAARIAVGEVDLGIVAGGEAMRDFAVGHAGKGRNGTEVIRGYRAASDDLLQQYGLTTPLEIYPLYEQATRHAWRQSAHEAALESAMIWAGNARAALANPSAWFRHAPEAAEIATASPRNPMLSWPYTRMMVANSSVNQAAALVVMSRERAAALGIPAERQVHVGASASASEPANLLDRAGFAESPAMRASLETALARNCLAPGDLDHVELYSCFPCVPKMARRMLGWPLERAHSIYGGLTFGGGPIGNCMTHALASLVERIRAGSRSGLVFANGGFATGNHAVVLRAEPLPGTRPNADCQGIADRMRGPVPQRVERWNGPARIETYSVPCRDGRPTGATIIATTPDDRRTLARIMPGDPALGRLIDPEREAVGLAGTVHPGADGLNYWSFA